MSSNEKETLYDVSIIRPIIIIFLIVYHCFIIFIGGWEKTSNFQPNVYYSWIGRFSYSFMLQAFVFISGYIYGFQIFVKKKETSFFTFASKKFQRLILPSIVFSTIYIFIYGNVNEHYSTFQFVKNILSGAGHLWFLPMLFWCFIIAFIIIEIWSYKLLILFGLMFLSLCSFVVPDFFGLNLAFQYLFFFYLGGYIYTKRSEIIRSYLTKKYLILVNFGFLLTFVVLSLVNDRLVLALSIQASHSYMYGLILLFKSTNTLVYSTLGVFALYLNVNYCVEVLKFPISNTILKINKYCFGIYIFQQFIIKAIYYKTAVPEYVSILIMPFLTLLIAILISFALTYILLKTKLGRYFL